MQQKDLSLSLPSLQIYFQSHRAEIDGQAVTRLVKFIESAKKTLDCAVYDLKDPDILNALKTVSGKVKLRIAFDEGKDQISGGTTADPKPQGTEQALKDAGLLKFATPVHVSGGHLMHSKYIVRDGSSIWTGSGNWTYGGLFLQDNNFLALDSVPLAAAYEKNFDDLVSPTHTHHEAKTNAVTPPAVKIGTVDTTPYFSGKGTELIEDAIVSLLGKAKKVRIMAMLISDDGILTSLKAFRPANKDIAGVLDPHEMAQVMKPPRGKPKDPELFWFAEGDKRFVAAPSHAYSNEDRNDFMHNKVMIFDDEIVVTGSYNFSESAESNDENTLVIRSPEVAKAYTRYFDALQAEYRKHGAHLPPETIYTHAREEDLAVA